MNDILNCDICVIGAGSGGLVVAAGAARMGADVVLVEKGEMGGDCLNTGCVPSKALIAAAAAAESARRAGRLGVRVAAPEADYAAVRQHIRGVIEAIAPNDSVARFEAMGVRVIRAAAAFSGPREVEAGGTRIRARRFVIATGSSPAVPPIPGLDEVSYLTNETVFELDARPAHLVIVGGGPIGVELAQAHRRLGAEVTVLEMASLLPQDDPEAVAVIRGRLAAEGVSLREGARVNGVKADAGGLTVTLEANGRDSSVSGSHLLLAAGRVPNVGGLGLEAAGVEYGRTGIDVDRRLRTSNRRIFAIGDVTGGLQFTHAAGYEAGIVLRNALFRLPAKADYRALPWVTYSDPELAQVGLTEAAARLTQRTVRVLRHDLADNDRAQTARDTDGFIKAVTSGNGQILGATIVAAHAGELIQPWVLAIREGLKIGALAGMVAPYPTLGEISRRAAGSFYESTLFSPRTRRLVRFLGRFG